MGLERLREYHYTAVSEHELSALRSVHPLLTLLLNEGARPSSRYCVGRRAFWVFESLHATNTARWAAEGLTILGQSHQKEALLESLFRRQD